MVRYEPPSVLMYLRGSSDPSSDPSRHVAWMLGEHDVSTRLQLAAALAPAARLDDADVVVDLSGVTFMDAATVGAIVDAHNRLVARSRSLSLRAPSALARRRLELCELAFLIDEHPAQAPAVAAALHSWVPVPVAGRASGPTEPHVERHVPAREPARVTAQRRAPG